MYGCESWTVKKAECWRIDAFKLWYWRALESPLNSKEIKPVNPKGNQLWIFMGRTDAKAPTLWPLDAKIQLIGKDLNAGKDWGQKEKEETEDEMVGWRHRLNGETPILWASDVKNWLIGKDLNAGKDWRQEEKGTTEDETVGWHHELNRHEFEQALGVGDEQGSLVCCSPWGHK